MTEKRRCRIIWLNPMQDWRDDQAIAAIMAEMVQHRRRGQRQAGAGALRRLWRGGAIALYQAMRRS